MKKRKDNEESNNQQVSDAFLQLQNIQPTYMENKQEGSGTEVEVKEGNKIDQDSEDKGDEEFERDDDFEDAENIDDDNDQDKGQAFEEGHDQKVKLKVNINVTNYNNDPQNPERKTKTEQTREFVNDN